MVTKSKLKVNETQKLTPFSGLLTHFTQQKYDKYAHMGYKISDFFSSPTETEPHSTPQFSVH